MNEQEFIGGALKAGLTPEQVSQAVRVYRTKNPQKSISGFVGNVGKSAIDTVSGIGNAIIHPVKTANNLYGLGSGIIQLAIPGEQGNEQLARAVGNYYANRYGGLDKAWNSFYNDPVGVAMDLSVLLDAGGSLVGKIGEVGKIDALARAGGLAKDVAGVTDPFKLVGKGASVATKNVFRDVPDSLMAASEKVATRGLGKAPKKLIQASERAGTTPAKFMSEYGLLDRSPEAAKAAKEGILSAYDELGIRNAAPMSTGDIARAFDRKIAQLQNGTSRFSDAGQKQIAELTRRKEQFLQSIGDVQNGQLNSVPLRTNTAQAIQFRRGALEPDIPQSMFGLDPHASGTAMGAKSSRDIIRNSVNATSPELKKLGLDYGVAKNMEDYFKAAQQRGAGKQMINFSRLGGAGLGGIMAGLPGAVTGYATEQIMNSPQLLSAATTGLQGASNLARNPAIGKIGSTVGNIGSTAYGVGKVASRFSSAGLPANPDNMQPQTRGLNKPVSPIRTSLPLSIPQPPVPPTPPVIKTKLPTYKMPKNAFKSTAAFGKKFTLRASN